MISPYDSSYTPFSKVNNLIGEDEPGDMIQPKDATDASARLMGMQPLSQTVSPSKATVKDSNIG